MLYAAIIDSNLSNYLESIRKSRIQLLCLSLPDIYRMKNEWTNFTKACHFLSSKIFKFTENVKEVCVYAD